MKKTVIALLALVVVLALAYFGYNYLSERYTDTSSTSAAGDSASSAVADKSDTAVSYTAQSTKKDDSTEKSDSREKAADFTFFDADGNEVKLSDFFGKPVVLNFWASWCGPCKYEMPELQKAFESSGKDINFIMLNLTDGFRETKETASDYISDMGYTFPVYFDESSDGANTYAVYSIPTTVIIDSDGYILARHSGGISEQQIAEYISQ